MGVARLSCETDAQPEDIKKVEFYLPKDYSGVYVLQEIPSEGYWLLHPEHSYVVDEDITVVLKVTFKNGNVAYDHATLKVRNNRLIFSQLSLDADESSNENKAYASDYKKDGDGIMHAIEYGVNDLICHLTLGVNTKVPRIKDSIVITSSDESVVKIYYPKVQVSGENFQFHGRIGAVGTVVITAKATDDSGVEVTTTMTVVVDQRVPMTDCDIISASSNLTGNENDGFVATLGQYDRQVKFGIENCTPSGFNAGGPNGLYNYYETYIQETGETTVTIPIGYYTRQSMDSGTLVFNQLFEKTVNVTVVEAQS